MGRRDDPTYTIQVIRSGVAKGREVRRPPGRPGRRLSDALFHVGRFDILSRFCVAGDRETRRIAGSRSSDMTRSNSYIPTLDGWRAIAIGLVIAGHASPAVEALNNPLASLVALLSGYG